MAVLEDKQKDQLKELFGGLQEIAKITLFKKEEECEFCDLTRELLEEVAGTSDKIELAIEDFKPDSEAAKKYGVDKVPAIVIENNNDMGIRFYGVPAGYEFTPLVEDIIAVSMRQHGLEQQVLDELEKIDQPVHIQVLTSPTCPYCPVAVRTAHRLAMASDHIVADMIDSAEYPDLVEKYDVQGVPHTVINETQNFVGPVPELELAYEILRALGKPAPPRKVHDHDHEQDHAHEEGEVTEVDPEADKEQLEKEQE